MHEMKRKTVPIVTGSRKVLGLTMAEWNLNLVPFSAYVIFAPGWFKVLGLLIHLILIAVYVQVSKRFEQDYLVIYVQNRKLPNIVYGILETPLPIDRLVAKEVFHVDK
jgi:hypothetical protein